MYRNRSAEVHQFSMVPRADIPRSRFKMQHTHKTSFDAGYLVPIYVDEVLPGDTFNVRATIFGRLATPIFPVMDNLHLDTFFFFVPHRLVWSNFKKMMGEQQNPGDSTSFNVPMMESPAGGYDPLTIYDYFGLPTSGQVDASGTVEHSVLPLRAYNLIFNEWFRDQNIVPARNVRITDSGDLLNDYTLQRRGKRHDYFTSALPWPQKGVAVSLPLGTTAPVIPGGTASPTFNVGTATNIYLTGDAATVDARWSSIAATANATWNTPSLVADLSQATAATVNQLRQSFQIQKLLERDARGGTRYTEVVRAHFSVISPDARLQRPEYLGGGKSRITINPIAQTSGSPQEQNGYTSTPQGTLAAIGTVLAGQHGFTQSFTEHGTIIGLACIRADLTYQQGLRRMWSRKTRYDFYWPAFAQIGEQAIYNKEIYARGLAADDQVFGYQERWSELRYHPSRVSGLFRSTTTGTIDAWHLAQRFNALPTLSQSFIEENPPLDRILAVGSAAAGQQLIADMFFDVTAVRPLPMYGVPGLIDHF